MIPAPVVLSSYRCTGFNRRTQRLCRAVVIDAWSLSGAVVRRRCGDCGTWQTIEVEGAGLLGLRQDEHTTANVLP